MDKVFEIVLALLIVILFSADLVCLVLMHLRLTKMEKILNLHQHRMLLLSKEETEELKRLIK